MISAEIEYPVEAIIEMAILQETVNQFAFLFTNVEQLERSRRAEVARLLIKAGAFI